MHRQKCNSRISAILTSNQMPGVQASGTLLDRVERMSPHSSRRGPRGPYAKTAKVREGILAAAREVFAESGFRGASIVRIAERAGVSERGLAHHFPGKEALLAAVLAQHQQRSADAVEATIGVDTIRVMLRVIEEDRADSSAIIEMRTVLAAEGIAVDHPAHSGFTATYAAVRAHIASAFTIMRAEGLVTSPLSSSELAAGLVALMDGTQLLWLYDRDGVDPVPVIEGYLAGLLTEEAMVRLRRREE